MYRVNPFPRNLLLVSDEVIRMSPMQTNPDPVVIQQAIQLAEDRFIRQIICPDLYDDIRNQKNVVVDSLNKAMLEGEFESTVTLNEGEIVNAIELVDNPYYVEFWNEHLWKLAAECVMFVATPTNWSKFSAQGQMINNPKSVAAFSTEGQGAASASIKDLQFILDKFMQDRIDPLRAAAENYLYRNAGKFPLYNCKKSSQMNKDGVSLYRKTSFVHGIYDKNSNCNSCND